METDRITIGRGIVQALIFIVLFAVFAAKAGAFKQFEEPPPLSGKSGGKKNADL